MMEDNFEEEIFFKSIMGHIELMLSFLSSNPTIQSANKLFMRLETILFLACLAIIIFTIIRLEITCKCNEFLHQIFTFNGHVIQTKNNTEYEEFEDVNDMSVVYSTQGLRLSNEDRAVTRKIVGWDPSTSDKFVHIFAILDGHGGEFSANFAKKHLFDSLEKSILKLKIITCSLSSSEKLKQYELHFKTEAPKAVLTYLGISDTQSPNQNTDTENDCENKADADSDNSVNQDTDKDSNKTNSSKTSALVSHLKTLGQLPLVSNVVKSNSGFMSKQQTKAKFKSKLSQKTGKNEVKVENKQVEITDYISSSGDILYPKLIKDEITKCDKDLLVNAKKDGNIGGTTLLLAVLDAEKLWVANVGDSRGVLCNDKGLAIPLSFDHKPCQLKEKKRIQEAGGFVSMNGVWRVQGVLATSRALGDYPLKDKNLIVSEPDVLAFDIKDHKPAFAVLASDGLWDTHSNEEVISFIKTKIGHDRLYGAKHLADDALSKGSLDNVTILIINFEKCKK